ncbi:hypothetical protein P691DRAFT_739708 [Macrolepiota fuliginosa MF-IS2]|uniref:Uncharacterized protein n=1 Tax=Macrolepiota fuliginosa MF-IS2 TaxID=1400762 RepID=A0A9P5X213_9AGAR|nr:hypothetical protein P691DRAFT_739708 [Macrolepiota fuliginosa MF-IS2]
MHAAVCETVRQMFGRHAPLATDKPSNNDNGQASPVSTTPKVSPALSVFRPAWGGTTSTSTPTTGPGTTTPPTANGSATNCPSGHDAGEFLFRLLFLDLYKPILIWITDASELGNDSKGQKRSKKNKKPKGVGLYEYDEFYDNL